MARSAGLGMVSATDSEPAGVAVIPDQYPWAPAPNRQPAWNIRLSSVPLTINARDRSMGHSMTRLGEAVLKPSKVPGTRLASAPKRARAER